VGWFLLSEAAGDLPLPFGDGRNLGLAAGSLLGVSVDLVLLGAFAAPLAGDGSGALAPIPVTLPSPLTLHAVGLSFDPLGPSFGHVSDVVRIEF